MPAAVRTIALQVAENQPLEINLIRAILSILMSAVSHVNGLQMMHTVSFILKEFVSTIYQANSDDGAKDSESILNS